MLAQVWVLIAGNRIKYFAKSNQLFDKANGPAPGCFSSLNSLFSFPRRRLLCPYHLSSKVGIAWCCLLMGSLLPLSLPPDRSILGAAMRLIFRQCTSSPAMPLLYNL